MAQHMLYLNQLESVNKTHKNIINTLGISHEHIIKNRPN